MAIATIISTAAGIVIFFHAILQLCCHLALDAILFDFTVFSGVVIYYILTALTNWQYHVHFIISRLPVDWTADSADLTRDC